MNKKHLKQKYEFTKRDYYWMIILFLFVWYLDFIFKVSHQIQWDFIANVLTFLSITNGFYITSLAMFAGSDFIKKLYWEQSEDPRYTLLHKLLQVFTFPFYFSISTILYLLFVSLLISSHTSWNSITKYWYEWFFLHAIIPLILINFYVIYKSFRIFKAFIKKTAET